jgi:hypothetical protein
MVGPPSNPPETDESISRSGDVAREVAILRTEVNQLKRSRAAQVAVVASIIATVISVVSGTLSLWQALVKNSKTVVSTGPALKMKYQPTTQSVSVTFDLMLQNLGNKDDAIRDLYGRITDLRTSLFAPLGANDFTCAIAGSTGAQQAGPVFYVPKGGSTQEVCIGSIRLAALSRRVFQFSGTKQLRVFIYGDSSYLLSACFPLDQQTATDLNRTTGPVVLRTFYFVPCEPEEAK